jgi:4'-phosphopantetheinyl transferase
MSAVMTPPLVWLADGRALGDDVLASFIGWLSPSETARYRAFLRPLRQRQFLIGRILLRQALGTLLGRAGRDICLLEQPGQAPRLLGTGSAGPGISISHSGPWVACAASVHSAVGLDIERVDRGRDLNALAAQAFDAAQYAWWSRRPEASRADDFYRLWTEEEARFKLQCGNGECVHLAHAELAIAVCQARPFGRLPQLELRSLDAALGGPAPGRPCGDRRS